MKKALFVLAISLALIAISFSGCDNPVAGLVKEADIHVRIGSTELASSDSYDLGSVVADGSGGISSEMITVTIGNEGNTGLAISSVALTGGNTDDFNLALGFSSPVGPEESTTFSIGFDPSTIGDLHATVSIGNSDKDKDPFTFSVTGEGLSQGKVATPSFNPQAGTYTSAQDIYISCSTLECDIFFTTNGDVPTTDSTRYTGAVMLDETTTLKAFAVKTGWIASSIASALYTISIDYALNFDSNGGSGSMSPQPITFGTSENIKANTFTRLGYSFAGWAATSVGPVIYADGASYTMSTQGATLYARWTPNNYNVVFNANGGSGSMGPQQIAFDSSANLSANAFSRTGHTFAGWATSSGGAVAYANGANYTMTTEGTTLYARWTANNYYVAFDANGGSGSMDPQQIAFDSAANLTLIGFSLTGYTFAGWATSSGGAVVYANGASYTMSTQGATLYAKWTANNYNVVFNANGGSGSMNPQQIAFDSSANLSGNAFYRTGYTFAGWATSPGGAVVYSDGASYTMTTEGSTLWAKWNIVEYTVTFNSQGGSPVSPQTIDYNGLATQPANPTHIYGIFAGWYREPECYNVWTFATDHVTADTVLYAKWTIAYSVGSTGPAGGKIFYENANYLADGWRFMEGAPDAYLFFSQVSQNTATEIAGADGTAIGTGLQNTMDIVAALGTSYTYGARSCYELSFIWNSVTYDDWFLPSKDELSAMAPVCGNGGSPSNTSVSSSEYSATQMWGYTFMGMVLNQANKTSSSDFRFFRGARRF